MMTTSAGLHRFSSGMDSSPVVSRCSSTSTRFCTRIDYTRAAWACVRTASLPGMASNVKPPLMRVADAQGWVGVGKSVVPQG